MKKALVCLAGGFIDGHLVNRLKRRGGWGPRRRSEIALLRGDRGRGLYDWRLEQPGYSQLRARQRIWHSS